MINKSNIERLLASDETNMGAFINLLSSYAKTSLIIDLSKLSHNDLHFCLQLLDPYIEDFKEQRVFAQSFCSDYLFENHFQKCNIWLKSNLIDTDSLYLAWEAKLCKKPFDPQAHEKIAIFLSSNLENYTDTCNRVWQSFYSSYINHAGGPNFEKTHDISFLKQNSNQITSLFKDLIAESNQCNKDEIFWLSIMTLTVIGTDVNSHVSAFIDYALRIHSDFENTKYDLFSPLDVDENILKNYEQHVKSEISRLKIEILKQNAGIDETSGKESGKRKI